MSDKSVSVMDIESRWTTEKGRWDKNKNTFVDRTLESFSRTLKMEIIERENGAILKFIGGPTGFESYYISDLHLTDDPGSELCICGGTINKWPSCFVNAQKVFGFMKSYTDNQLDSLEKIYKS